MRRILALLLMIFAVAGTARGQVIERHIDTQGAHVHAGGVIHVTDWLNDLPEIATQYRQYLAWHAEGRPGLVPMSDEVAAAQFTIGTLRTFKVHNFDSEQADDVEFRLMAIGEHARLWVATDQIGPNRINDEVTATIMEYAEQRTPANSIDPGRGILPIEKEIFGLTPNVDGSGFVNILLVDIKDGWSAENGGGFVAGFVNTADLNPNNPNGNAMDILYIDTYPGIYRDNQAPNPIRPLSTLAHELQHLINARYGRMPTFQDEGQSEWAEILLGFSGRGINYLNSPAEVNTWLYQWRHRSNDVLNDYQRAGLFHTYLAGRLGAERMGELTRQNVNYRPAYDRVLEPAGLNWEDVLAEFHVANWLNNREIDARYGYTAPQRLGVRATETVVRYSGQSEATSSRNLRYGGAEYVQWLGVRDLQMTLAGEPGMRFFGILREDGTATPEVRALEVGGHTFTGSFESITLVATNVRPQNQNETIPSQRAYSYETSWSPLPFVQELIRYAATAEYYAELPGDPRTDSRRGIRAFALRITPEVQGRVDRVSFWVNARQDSSLMGTGNLQVGLYESRLEGGSGATRILSPAAPIDSVAIPLSQLNFGENSVDVGNRGWYLSTGSDYHIVLRVTDGSSNARVEFLIDAGNPDQTNSDYWPARTRLYIEPPSQPQAGWYRYSNNNNLLLTVNVVGLYTGPMEEPVITEQPVSQTVAQGGRLEVSVAATGQPAVQYQWRRNGEDIPGATQRVYVVEQVGPEHAGEYTVRVTNLAGSSLSDPATIEVEAAQVGIVSVYPNPMFSSGYVEFYVDRSDRIRIEVFDMLGRRVRVLTERRYEQGRHAVSWSGAELGSGSYVVRMQGDLTGSHTWKLFVAR